MSETREESAEADHLDDVDDGLGCAEVWEELSERRAQDANGDGAEGDGADGDERDGDGADVPDGAGTAAETGTTVDGVAALADEADATTEGTDAATDESGT